FLACPVSAQAGRGRGLVAGRLRDICTTPSTWATTTCWSYPQMNAARCPSQNLKLPLEEPATESEIGYFRTSVVCDARCHRLPTRVFHPSFAKTRGTGTSSARPPLHRIRNHRARCVGSRRGWFRSTNCRRRPSPTCKCDCH